MHSRFLALALLIVLVAAVHPPAVASEPLTNPDFVDTWSREDGPVARGSVSRSWVWGPDPFTGEIDEPYASLPGGFRTVQYFDKARMEINDPGASPGRWYVTAGLLASEMMSGAMQVGPGEYIQRGPALIPVAGDAADPTGPTYSSFDNVRFAGAFPTGTTLVATIDRSGNVGWEQRLASYGVLAERHIPETRHTVASVFWAFLNSSGTVLENGEPAQGLLFEPWYYATGLPLTEAYWASVSVGGEQKDVLIQVFERRVLTYTPSNPPAWRVEAGNVGLHYFWWRYEREAGIPEASWTIWAPQIDGPIAINMPPVDSGFQLVAHAWYDDPDMRVDAYRVSVEMLLNGQGEAGLGVHLRIDSGRLGSLVYFGVNHSGQRYVTLESFDGGGTEYLLRPAPVSALNSTQGEWIELAVTVHGGRVWFEVAGSVVAEIEIREDDIVPGVALVSGRHGGGTAVASATFRQLQIQHVRNPR